MDVKEKILNAAIELIEEKKQNPEEVTVRDICKKAGVGISQINYHFQSKDNLIAQCIQKIIEDVIGSVPRDKLTSKTPMESLLLRMLYTLDFLYSHENISKISILTDHKKPQVNDNTQQTINGYLPLIKEVCIQNNIKEAPEVLCNLLILTVQGLFLRTDTLKQTLGIDMRDRETRKQVISGYLNILFKGDN